jgi:hypothetical protein
MSRRDYVRFAALVRDIPGQGAGPAWIAQQMATIFAADNPNFDRDRFLAACEVSA